MRSAQDTVAAINAQPIQGAYGKDRMLISATADKERGSRKVRSVTVQWSYVHRMNDVSRATVAVYRNQLSPFTLASAINHSTVRARVSAALGI
jgi:hypothetical protein